jgi:AcrR family transcriptional regulator
MTSTAATKTAAGSSPVAAPPRRGRPSTGARERILEAAIEVLKSDGYAGLTIAKVAAKAGESKPLVVYHYGSKQGLVQASGRAVAELITEEALSAVQGARTVEEIVRGIADGLDRLLEQDERLARIYFDLAAVSVVDAEVRRTITEVNNGWQVVLIDLLKSAEDGPPAAHVRALALMINACNQGLVLERIERGATAEWKRARELFIQGALAATSHSRN